MFLAVGLLLIIWLLLDMIKGEVWSYRPILRYEEPIMYWFVMSIWSALAFWCLMPYLSYLFY